MAEALAATAEALAATAAMGVGVDLMVVGTTTASSIIIIVAVGDPTDLTAARGVVVLPEE
jgi:hypothetical protein